jgi:ketosteroid isomerase-like protein
MTSQTAAALIQDEITAANARFMAAYRKGDAAAVAACYTAGSQLLPAGGAAVPAAGIESFWRGAMQMGVQTVAVETTELDTPAGDTAIETGQYTLRAADDSVIDRGKYLVVWKREGGTWKLHRDIWTTSVPAGG